MRLSVLQFACLFNLMPKVDPSNLDGSPLSILISFLAGKQVDCPLASFPQAHSPLHLRAVLCTALLRGLLRLKGKAMEDSEVRQIICVILAYPLNM